MKHDKSQNFRFRMNSESTQPYFQEDVEDQRLKRLGRRVTMLTFLIPTLFGLVLFFGYQDLKKGYSNLRDTDMVESEKLSQILNSKFSSISIQVAKLEESLGTIQDDFKTLEASFNKKVMPLNEIYLVFEKTTSALKDNLKNTEKTIDRLNALKSDKSDVTTAIAKIEKKISPFYQDLKNMEAEIKALDENLTQELAELSSDLYKVKNGLKQFDAIKKEINDFKILRKDISSIASKQSNQVDKKTLDKVMQDHQKQLEKDLAALNATMKENASKINALEDNVQELMKFKALSEIKKRLEPKSSPSAKISDSDQELTKTPPSETTPSSPPKPGTILEETLR